MVATTSGVANHVRYLCPAASSLRPSRGQKGVLNPSRGFRRRDDIDIRLGRPTMPLRRQYHILHHQRASKTARDEEGGVLKC